MARELLERTLAHKLHKNKEIGQEALGALDEKLPSYPPKQSSWLLKEHDDQILSPKKLQNSNFQDTHKITRSEFVRPSLRAKGRKSNEKSKLVIDRGLTLDLRDMLPE